MKKNTMIAAVLCCLLIGESAWSQPRLGALFAPNYCGASIVSHEAYDGLNSDAAGYRQRVFIYQWSAGLVADFKLGKALRFRPGILYSRKGWTERNIEGTNVNVFLDKEEYRVDYLEVPLDIVYGTSVGKGKAFIGGGAYVAYGLKGTEKVIFAPGYNRVSSFYHLKFDVEDQRTYFGVSMNRIDYGINSLMGYEFNFGLFLDFRYELGLRNVYYKSVTLFDPAKYNYFQLSVGYMIKWKK